MKKVIIVGSSGMIGSIILRECLASDAVSQVTSIVRRPSGIAHPKLRELVHSDYLDYSAIAAAFEKQDVAHFCIGVYTGQVSDTEFKKITVDFVKVFADNLVKNSPNVRFCFLSGAGADLQEKSRMSFARYKGMAENYLMAQSFAGLHIFRPGYIYPVEKREEPNLSYRLFRFLYPVMNRLFPSSSITSENLGKAMFIAGLKGFDATILENETIKQVI